MSDLIRTSFSLEKSLADRLERLVRQRGYTNRSEFVRDMIRDRLVQEEWEGGKGDVVGTVTMVYDHEQRELSQKLTSIQHHHHHSVLATTHVHLDHHRCAEMVMVKAPAEEIRHIADEMGQQKGVLHVSLSISSTGKGLH